MKTLSSPIFLSSFLVTILLGAYAHSAGFTIGNELTVTHLRGEVAVTCIGPRGERDYNRFQCDGEVVSPRTHSTFQMTPNGVVADKVELVAHHEDGSTRAKEEGFDYVKGASKESFNLWIYDIFRRPLLQWGRNTIQYNLKRRGHIVHSGDFEAYVVAGETRVCPRADTTSYEMRDCQMASRVCNDYFAHFNYCRSK